MIMNYKIHQIVSLISFENQYITIITGVLYIFIQHNSCTCQEKFQKKFVFSMNQEQGKACKCQIMEKCIFFNTVRNEGKNRVTMSKI